MPHPSLPILFSIKQQNFLTIVSVALGEKRKEERKTLLLLRGCRASTFNDLVTQPITQKVLILLLLFTTSTHPNSHTNSHHDSLQPMKKLCRPSSLSSCSSFPSLSSSSFPSSLSHTQEIEQAQEEEENQNAPHTHTHLLLHPPSMSI